MEARDRAFSGSSIEVSEFSSVVLPTSASNQPETLYKRKKVGLYLMHLDHVLGKGSFAKVYFGEKADKKA